MKRLLSGGSLLVLALALVAVAVLPGDNPRPDDALGQAADISQFNPGNIISDSVFFNAAAMSAADIDAFIRTKGISCRAGSDGTPCLKDFRQTTTTRAADSYCQGYSAAANESAAVIIAKVATSCGINPQVLLVILQKEQGLLTDSAGSLYATRYQKAMGFACPDTAACDSTYFGFQNQVYAGARQYRRYAAEPQLFGYRAGRTSNIQWSPNAACGSSPVFVQNQATAGLYIYTPYQPNAAALAAGYGTGDGCSAYGNRNFWLYFTDWFGSTQAPGQTAWQPVGMFDDATVQGPIVQVSGWAADPDDLGGVTTVHVYVDGVGVAILQANQPRSEITGDHGYATQIPMTVGSHQVCTYGINVGRGTNNTVLGCQTVTVTSSNGNNPLGTFAAAGSGRTVTVGGWALDPDAQAAPLTVHVYADGIGVAILSAVLPGSPANTYFPGAGDLHTYGAAVPLAAGRHNVCAYGINSGAGTVNTMLGCSTVTLDAAAYNPTGAWDPTTLTDNVLHVSGWAADGDAPAGIQVHVYVNGVGMAILTATGPNATSDGHGFAGDVRLPAGTSNVCLYAINVGDGTTNPQLGCRSTTIATSVFNPKGALDDVSAVGGAVTVKGWATDIDTPTSPITVHVYADGRPLVPTIANGTNPTADGHGYTATVSLAAGEHTVCTYAINVGTGTTNPQLGCRSISVQTNPVGALETVTAVGGTVSLSGWATDPDVPGDAVQVHVYADGVAQFPMIANGSNPAAEGHGYSASFTLPEGTHSVCTYAINVGPGNANPQLGCRSVTVSHNPGGALDRVTAIGGAVSLSGWSTDPDAPSSPVTVHVYLDGVPQFAVLADQANPAAPGHGYAASLTLTDGTHTVCTYAINQGAGTTNPQLGCQKLTISRNPSGELETATVTGTTVAVSGWAADPDIANQAVTVHVYLDGTPQFAVAAGGTNTTVDGHGYAASLTVGAGTHSVCTWAINAGAGNSNTLLGCRTVVVG